MRGGGYGVGVQSRGHARLAMVAAAVEDNEREAALEAPVDH